MKNATFRQLRVFSEVARHLSFSKAAHVLHLTPPAITMQIKELEGHIGLPLFERNGRSVSLTTAGEYILVYARKVLSTLKDAEDAAARLKRVEVGVLKLGLVSTAKYFLPRLLVGFRQQHPGIDIKLIVGNREQLVQALRDAEVDIAIMGSPPKEFSTRAEPFAAHPHVFVCAPDHPLYQLGQIPASALSGQAMMVRELGSGTRTVMERFFDEQRVHMGDTTEISSNETIKQAVMAGMGISLLSLHTLGMELQTHNIAILDVEGSPIMRRWHVIHTLSKLLSPAAEALRYYILEHGESFLADHFGAYLGVTP